MIGKALGGQVTHLARPDDPTSSVCGRVQGTLRIESGSTRVGCRICRAGARVRR